MPLPLLAKLPFLPFYVQPLPVSQRLPHCASPSNGQHIEVVSLPCLFYVRFTAVL